MNLKPLVQLNSFTEAQVVRSFLASQGLHPVFMDESMRTIAPHLDYFMGPIRIFIPESEYDEAIDLLREKRVQGLKSNLVESPAFTKMGLSDDPKKDLAINNSSIIREGTDLPVKGDILKNMNLKQVLGGDAIVEDPYVRSLLKRLQTLLILSLVILPVLPNIYSLYLIYMNREVMQKQRRRLSFYVILNIAAALFTLYMFAVVGKKVEELKRSIDQISDMSTIE